MGFGLGFIFGPFVGGELGRIELWGRVGSLAALCAAGLSVVNFVLAVYLVPESLPPEKRGVSVRRLRPFDPESLRAVTSPAGMRLAVWLSFGVVFFFTGLEQTFRLYTEDGFGMGMEGTGRLFAVMGVMGVVIQGGLLSKLSRRFGEVRLIRVGTALLAVGFAGVGTSAGVGLPLLYAGCALIAIGSSLHTPSLSSYASRRADATTQGQTLGVFQSVGALARVIGPVVAGLSYQFLGMRGPYLLGAAGMVIVALAARRLPELEAKS
jgi:DHA1 family tetracycline resistance protein-like MFS transporter